MTTRLSSIVSDTRDVRGCVAEAAISSVVSRCPFLSSVAVRGGESAARELVLDPAGCLGGKARPATSAKSPRPIFMEDNLSALLASFESVHGVGGMIPLRNRHRASSEERSTSAEKLPTQLPTQLLTQPTTMMTTEGTAPMPLASISLSGGFGKIPDAILNALKSRMKNRHAGKRNGHGRGGGNSKGKRSRVRGEPSTKTTTQPTPSKGSELDAGAQRFSSPSNKAQPLQCPKAIVALRAAVANLKPIRQLRPYALPVRAIALAGATVSCNVPMGMVRRHTKKFSLEWVVVVHAVIPFIAALRKACLMPAWGLGLTVAGSIAGQWAGEKLEGKRMEFESGGLPMPSMLSMLSMRFMPALDLGGVSPDSFVAWLLS